MFLQRARAHPSQIAMASSRKALEGAIATRATSMHLQWASRITMPAKPRESPDLQLASTLTLTKFGGGGDHRRDQIDTHWSEDEGKQRVARRKQSNTFLMAAIVFKGDGWCCSKTAIHLDLQMNQQENATSVRDLSLTNLNP